MAFHHPSRANRMSYGAGSNLPPKGAYGITRNGDVWKNEENIFGQKYPVWRAEKNWLVEDEADEEALKNDNVGYRSSFDAAVTAARGRAGSPGASPSSASSSGAQLPSNLVGKTWNDGSYTYVVKSTTEAFVPETGVTFRAPDVPTEDRWNRFVKQLQAANLKEGKASPKPKSSGGGGGSPVKTDVPAPPDESITDKVWFWPVAILVPTVAVIGGILFWPSKKKAAPVAAAAPAAIPVASNPRRRRSKRSKR